MLEKTLVSPLDGKEINQSILKEISAEYYATGHARPGSWPPRGAHPPCPGGGGAARTRWAHKPAGRPWAAGSGRPLPQAWPQMNPHIPRRPSASLHLRGPPPAPGRAPSEDVPTVLGDPGTGTKAPALPPQHVTVASGASCLQVDTEPPFEFPET